MSNENQGMDYLALSDEEMLNMVEPVSQVETNEEETEERVEDEGTPEQGVTEDVDGSDKEEDSTQEEEEESPEVTGAGPDDAPTPPKDTVKETDVNGASQKPVPPTKTVDYKAEYERLLTPFKANGRDIKVESVDDAITLMQMGANYNKKMAALKPNLKLMKMLENNGLLSEEKLSYLIDLGNKNPNAINKLVHESGINPMDFDAEKAGEYRPNVHTVDDRELALDSVLDSIQDTPTYNRTLEIVSKEWDGASKQIVADHPELLNVINDHLQRGVYDIISTEVERQRMLGRLTGLSSFDAYRQVGDAIQAQGGFDHLGSSQGNSKVAKPVVTPKPKPDNSKLKDQKRAASSSKPGASNSSTPGDFNPLAMSDEEFAKLSESKYR